MPIDYYNTTAATIANNIAIDTLPIEVRYQVFFIYKKRSPSENDVLFTRSNKGEYKYCYFNNAPILSNYGLNTPPGQYTAHKADSFVLIKLLEYPTMCEALPKIFIRDLLIFLANNA